LHLETPSVFPPPRAGEITGLLAGDPRTPRHRPSGAVPVGSHQAEELRHGLSLRRIEYDVRRTSEMRIPPSLPAVIAERGVETLRQARVVGERTDRPRREVEFVVAHQDQLAVIPGENLHPVRKPRRPEPV